VDRMWVRARAAVWVLGASLALLGTPAAALAARGHHPAPDLRTLWRAYPLGTQPLAGSTATGPAAPRIRRHSSPIERSANGDPLPIGFPQMLTVAALLAILAAMAPIAVRRRRSRPVRAAAGRAAVAELIDPLRSARRELIDAQPAPPPRPAPTRDETIVAYAAAYAAASARGDRAPMAAVRALVPATVADPAAFAKRVIAEARRRDLLTSHGRGHARGELTPKALALVEHAPVA
jgi:hypothetical protein